MRIKVLGKITASRSLSSKFHNIQFWVHLKNNQDYISKPVPEQSLETFDVVIYGLVVRAPSKKQSQLRAEMMGMKADIEEDRKKSRCCLQKIGSCFYF